MSPARTRRDDQLPDLSKYGRLAEYRAKRRFDVTPEPPPRMRSARGHESASGKAGANAGRAPLEFVIQKHRAGHLHYDFRLEHEGVMLSWAVPKGPALDPAIKRLAMETEPHPMDYNQFEGVIPEGEYGGGTVMIWDRGTWWPETDDVGRALAKGDLKFRLEGKKVRGSWVLVRTHGRNWLLIKHRDAHVSADDVTLTKPLSVVSRRTLAAIARAAGASPRQLEQAAGADPPRQVRGTVGTVRGTAATPTAPATSAPAKARRRSNVRSR
jgi:bifunctional non-homologous end joining protein LigD